VAAGRPEVLVLGAGVVGLTTAICLAESGVPVRVRSADDPLRTTSVLAGAMIGPTFAPPGDRLREWERVTVEELTRTPRVPGVHLGRGLLTARPAGMKPPFADAIPGFQPAAPGELPEGFGTGFWVTLPLVDMAPYMAYLVERLRAAGVDVEVRPVASLAEAAREASRVVNCTGLASRELAGDPEVRPVRGIKVVVANPGLETFFLEAPLTPAWASYFPHGDHVVLGGVAEVGADGPEVSAEEVDDLMRRCVEVEPRLAGAAILEQRVGLRPGRPSIRLEAETIEGALCVHNYGHGGIGVTMAWGCAREAASLLEA
jgi:D-amino-acid oxidase